MSSRKESSGPSVKTFWLYAVICAVVLTVVVMFAFGLMAGGGPFHRNVDPSGPGPKTMSGYPTSMDLAADIVI